MPSKTFSIFHSPFTLPHQLLQNPFSNSNSITHFKPYPRNSSLFNCTTTTNSYPKTHETFLQSQIHIPVSKPEPEPVDPTASTRGEIFLEHHQTKVASKMVIAATSKKKTKKIEKQTGFLEGFNSVASCYGCGAPLQTREVDAPGYVDPDTYELKKKHHQLRTILCGRCRLLSHGHMITAVGGHGGYAGGKQFITAEQLRNKLSHLRHEKALIVKLVDIVDFHGSFLSRVRDLTGANPIILVVTKIDLLPKGTNLNCIGDWVVEATTKKKLNVLSVHLTSSKSLVGIAGVVAEIQKEKKGRDVYIMGSANVGKSAFINALLKMMAERDPVAAGAQKYKPIQSAVPGTTLGPIQINAFIGGKLYDTPGVHLHHRQAAVVHSDDLPDLAPKSRLKGLSFPNSQALRQNNKEIISGSCGLEGFSVFWGGLVRVDVLQVLPWTRLTFYGPKALQIHIVPTKEADEFYKKEIGVLLTPPTGKQRTESWSGLETEHRLQLRFDSPERPTSDIAVSGLGWISIEPVVSKEFKMSHPELELPGNELQFSVHVPKPVEIFVRPPMPVGKAGSEWYQYRELTEVEEETRPKWYY